MTNSAAGPGAGGRIDFRMERRRYGDALGRKELLARLDAQLRPAAGRLGGYVLVTGQPGMGKSALLCHWLRLREDQGEPVPHHLVRRHIRRWARPQAVLRNLLTQTEELFPEQADPAGVQDAPPEHLLEHLLGLLERVSEQVLARDPARRLVLLIDGLDEAEDEGGGHADPLGFVPAPSLPDGVFLLLSSRPIEPHMAALRSLHRVEHVALEVERASGEAACRALWVLSATAFEPPLPDPLVEEAIRRAQGNVLYTEKLRDWLKGQPAERRQVVDLPGSLEDFLKLLWQDIVRLPEAPRRLAQEGLGLLCAAREALPLSVLGELLEDALRPEDLLRATRHLLLEEPGAEEQTGEHGAPAYRLYHESFHKFVAGRLAAELPRHHRRLAAQLAAWPCLAADPFRRDYTLRHAVSHRLGARDGEGARRLATDLSFMEARIAALGPEAVEADLERTVAWDPEAGDELLTLSRALRAEAHWLRKDSSALAGLLFTRLINQGWTTGRIDATLRLSPGVPVLRLRHQMQRRDRSERTLLGHSGKVSACTITPDGQLLISASSGKIRYLSYADGQLEAGPGNENLHVWDLATGRILFSLRGHLGPIIGCVALSDGRRLLSASAEGTVKLWDLASRSLLASRAGHAFWPEERTLAASGGVVVMGSRSGVLQT